MKNIGNENIKSNAILQKKVDTDMNGDDRENNILLNLYYHYRALKDFETSKNLIVFYFVFQMFS